MAGFIYLCPNTGINVRAWFAGEVPANGTKTYETVTCTACLRLHLVNPKTGKVLFADEPITGVGSGRVSRREPSEGQSSARPFHQFSHMKAALEEMSARHGDKSAPIAGHASCSLAYPAGWRDPAGEASISDPAISPEECLRSHAAICRVRRTRACPAMPPCRSPSAPPDCG
jgi:hypothetical protein